MTSPLRIPALLAVLAGGLGAGDAEPAIGTTPGPSLHGQPGISPDIAKPVWSSRVEHDDVGVRAVLALAGQEVTLRYIPAGTLQLGGGNAAPARRVEIAAFWLGDTEVTQAVWQAVMGANPSRERGDELPVTGVGWDDCRRFLDRLNHGMAEVAADLPSEAQWEYACRAGNTELPGPGLSSLAWFRDNAGGHPHPVRGRIANPWGIYDMLGNVREWCADDPQGGSRPVRGGGWEDDAERVDPGRHDAAPPQTRSPSLGFRIAIHGT